MLDNADELAELAEKMLAIEDYYRRVEGTPFIRNLVLWQLPRRPVDKRHLKFLMANAEPLVTPFVFRCRTWDEMMKAFAQATGLAFAMTNDGEYLYPPTRLNYVSAQPMRFWIYEIHPTYGSGLSYTLYQLCGFLAKFRTDIRVLYFGNDEIWISSEATIWEKALYIVSEFFIAFHSCDWAKAALENVLWQLFAFKAQDSGSRHYKRVVVDRIMGAFNALLKEIRQYKRQNPFVVVCIIDNLNLQTDALAKCDRFLRFLYEFCHQLDGWLIIGYSAGTRIRMKWAANELVVSHLFTQPFTREEAQLFAQSVIPIPEQAFFGHPAIGHWDAIQSWTGLYPKELVCMMQVPLRCLPGTSTADIFGQYALASMNDLKPVFKGFIHSEPRVLQTQQSLVYHSLCGKSWHHGLDYTQSTFFRLTGNVPLHPVTYWVTNLHKGMELLIKQNQFNLGQNNPSTMATSLVPIPHQV